MHICTTTTKINTGGKKEKVNNKVHYNIQQFINLYESIWLREEEKPLTGFFSQRQLLEDDKMLNNHSERSSSPLSGIFTISNIHRAYIVNVQLAVLCGSPLTGVYNVHPPRPHTHNRHMPRCLNQLIFIKLNFLSSPRHFLATLVALHFTPVSKSVSGRSFGLQPSSVALSLRACFLICSSD